MDYSLGHVGDALMIQQAWQVTLFVSFTLFVAGKVTGVMAAWSWWWLLMSAVPVFSYFLGWA
jgi:hypothetical protein